MKASSALAVQGEPNREELHLSAPSLQKVQGSLGQPVSAGILVLDQEGRVIYQSLGAQNIQNNVSYFPQIVARFYAEITESAGADGGLNSFISRVCSLNSERYLFRALPLRSQEDPSGFRHLLILFEPMAQLDQREPQIELTPRETRVVRLLFEGKTNKEVATCMRIGEYTVKDHIKRIMRKFGVTTRTGIIAKSLANTLDPHSTL